MTEQLVVEDGRGLGAPQKLSRTQKVVARRMVEAKRGVPEFTVAVDVEMDAAAALRAELKAGADGAGGPVPSYNDMIVRACALALREHPAVNGSFDEEAGAFRLWEHVNVGVAVEAGARLVVPTVRDADVKSLAQIAQADANYGSSNSQNFCVTASGLGLSEIDSHAWSLYPNPSKGLATIDLSELDAESVLVQSVTGDVVDKFDQVSGKLSLNTSNYAKGVYVISVVTKNGLSNKRLVVQ